jgi:hypothetical protein
MPRTPGYEVGPRHQAAAGNNINGIHIYRYNNTLGPWSFGPPSSHPFYIIKKGCVVRTKGGAYRTGSALSYLLSKLLSTDL